MKVWMKRELRRSNVKFWDKLNIKVGFRTEHVRDRFEFRIEGVMFDSNR